MPSKLGKHEDEDDNDIVPEEELPFERTSIIPDEDRVEEEDEASIRTSMCYSVSCVNGILVVLLTWSVK